MTRNVAFITGASAGIGEAFAERLAQDGYDLVLTARRADRLEDLAQRLEKEFGISAEPVPADLTNSSELEALQSRIRDEKRLALLVNNAGFGGYRPFAEIDPGVADDLVDVHVRSTVLLTRAALPGMVSKDDGAIINIASMLAFSGTLPPAPLPARATYAAAKSFVVTFTQLLAGELSGSGVKVMVCCPGVVETEFHDVQGIDLSHVPRMSAADMVSATLAGLARGEVVCCPTLEDDAALERLGEAQRAMFTGIGSRDPQPPAIASRYRD